MTAQAGQDLLIKIDMSGDREFVTLAGLRASKIAFNAQTINATHIASPGRWREILGGAGIRSASLSGSGIFVDGATDARVQQLFFAGETPMMQLIVPDFGVIEGRFQITSLEYAGNYDGEMTYDIALASAGELIFANDNGGA